MDISARTTSLPDVTSVSSAPRPTAPPSVAFSDVLASSATGVVGGAEQAMTVLPGGPILATALRSAATRAQGTTGGGVLGGVGANIATPTVTPVTATGSTGSAGTTGAASVSSAAEGPQTTSSSTSLGTTMLNAVASGGAGTDPTSGIDSSLAQSQQQNLYYLQVQEQVNQQDRSFSTLSNVLKSEHDTMKTAIGNIH